MTVNEAPARDRLGRFGESERSIVVLKPGNSGGAKGPQFKDNAKRGKDEGIGSEPTNS